MDVFEPDPKPKRGHVDIPIKPGVISSSGGGNNDEPIKRKKSNLKLSNEEIKGGEGDRPDPPQAETPGPSGDPPNEEKKEEKPKDPTYPSVTGVIDFNVVIVKFIMWICKDEVMITTPVLKLHYRTTAFLLLWACAILNLGGLVENKISCFIVGEEGPISPDKLKPINNYCWVKASYTIVGEEHLGAHPGVGPKKTDDMNVHVAYYRWVELFLMFQIVLFRAPKFIWGMLEGLKIRMITKGLKEHVLDSDTKKEDIANLVKYFVESLHTHSSYAIAYFLCELLSIANVIGQLYLTNRFLGGSFLNYGVDYVEWLMTDAENRNDPMYKVFPRVTKCDFYKYGPSGDIQNVDVMCVLPQNMYSEKFFVVFWFWFIGLACCTVVNFIFTFLRLTKEPLKIIFISHKTKYIFSRRQLNLLIRHANFGDWFVLLLISYNMDSNMFCAFIKGLIKEIQRQEVVGRMVWNEFNTREFSSDEDDDHNFGNQRNAPNVGPIRPSAPRLNSTEASPISSTLTVVFEDRC